MLLSLLLMMAGSALGQQPASNVFDEEERLVMLCRDYGDSIAVRWAPTTWSMFESLMTQGATLTRTEYLPGGDSIETAEALAFPSKQAWQNELGSLEGAETIHRILYEEIDQNMIPEGILGHYRQTELQAMRLGFLLFTADLHFPLAEALTLGYMDRKGSGIRSAKYTVSINGTTQYTSVINNYKSRMDPTLIDQVYSLPEDHVVTLRWDNYYNLSGYMAFHVEHSLDSIQWERINEVPIAIADQGDVPHREWVTYTDSVPSNFVDQYYRIQGVNSFGELGPYSKAVKTQARPPLQINSPFIYRASNRGDTSIQVYWRLAGRDSQLVQQLIINRAPHPDSNFLTLDTLDGLARSYHDGTAGYENYYFIQAVDPYGRFYSGSIGHGQLPDRVPPEPPQDLSAESDSLGNIRLTWRPNMEKDLIGYRVFYQRYEREDFIQLTVAVTSDTFFAHKLELDLLHDHAFYGLRAEDHVGNRSAFSELVKVQLPDTLAPGQPSIISVHSDFDGCIMQIIPSGSDDVVNHVLLRKLSIDESAWEAIDTLLQETQTYLDSLLQVGAEASYQVIAADKSGNRSQSNIALGRRIDNKIRPTPQNAMATWSADDQQLVFSWSYPPRNDLMSIRLYKKDVGPTRMYTFKMLRPTAATIVAEHDDSIDYTYAVPMQEPPIAGDSYRIKINFRDGAESGIATFDLE